MYEANQRVTWFLHFKSPLKEAGVALPPPPAWARGSVGGSSESAAVGVRVRHTHSTSLSSFQRQHLPRGAPVPGVGGGCPESPSLGSGAGELAPQGFVSVNSGQGPLHLQTAQGWDGWGKEAFSDIHGCSWAASGALYPSVGTSLQDKIPPGSLAYLPGRHWEGWP